MDVEAQLIIYDATTGFERLKNAYKEQADELEALTAKIEQLEHELDFVEGEYSHKRWVD